MAQTQGDDSYYLLNTCYKFSLNYEQSNNFDEIIAKIVLTKYL